MSRLPRFALGTVQPSATTQPITWALLEALTQQGCQTQHFHSRACYLPCSGAASATGLSSRHLDSWLMTREACQASLVQGVGSSELAIVEGRFDIAEVRSQGPLAGSSLDKLCAWLDLPRVVMLDVTQLRNCCLPDRIEADALILDRIESLTDFCRWKTTLESIWGVPVLGALESLPALRAALAAVPCGSALPKELGERFGIEFARYARLDELRRLAASRDFSPRLPSQQAAAATGVTVAVAYDEAFRCYFPDTLDALEALGATVVDFSPLHDESLPPGTDVVYIGCGHPELHAAALAENYCMLSALRTHLCAGRRIFADGGGLAYLCQSLETSEGRWAAMVGALPAIARLNREPSAPQPIEATLLHPTWLGAVGDKIRGYLSDRWQIEPNGFLTGCLAESQHECDLIGLYHSLGSRVQMHLAAQPKLLRSFVKPLPADEFRTRAAMAIQR